MDTNYPSNSYTQRKAEEQKEEKHLEPVVAHDVQVRKKSIFKKFTDIFIAEDMSSIKSYIISEILIPGCKRAIISTVEMMLNGKGYSSNRRDRPVTTISYRDYYDKPSTKSEPVRNDYLDFEELIFAERGDAELVLDQMYDILREYKVVHVSDMFEISKQQAPYTGNRYGWTDLTMARVVPVRGGYAIKMPKAMPIDRA